MSGDIVYSPYSSPQTGVAGYSDYNFYGYSGLTYGFTVTLWIYEGSTSRTTRYYVGNNSFDGTAYDFYGDEYWGISQTADGDLQFEYSGNTANIAMNPDWIQRWTFAVGWYDGTDIKLYYSMGDALQNPRVTNSVSPAFLRNGIIIGGKISSVGGLSIINGCDDTYLYDIRVYDYALTLDEITNVYNYGKDRIYPRYTYYK
jgi:hypothetical protein